MINIAIVEDSEIIRHQIITLITKTLFSKKTEYEIFQYESSEAYLAKDDEIIHHILLLDIELPGMSGVDLARSISKKNRSTIIMFLTSYDHYIKDAFGINVHRYIMKDEYEMALPIAFYEVLDMLENREKR